MTTTVKSLGVAQPVDDLVNELNTKHKILDAALAQYNYDGHYWGVPTWSQVQVIIYRADWFKEAGLAAPKTWDMLAAAQKLHNPPQRYGAAVNAGKNLACDKESIT